MMAMMKNTSNIDRAIRLMIGILLLIVAFAVDAVANNMVLKVIVLAFSTMNLISALTAFCPVYFAAGLSTLKTESPSESHNA